VSLSEVQPFDEGFYIAALQHMAGLSRLFSDNDSPLINSRFLERLFCRATGSLDLGPLNKVFDAKASRARRGVGVKTFLWKGESSFEKIQEFTRVAGAGHLNLLRPEKLVSEIVRLRNGAIRADCNEYDIDLKSSLYHCLVRVQGGAFIFETPYLPIDVQGIHPVDKQGKDDTSYRMERGGIRFSDGNRQYIYSPAKSVLKMRFEVGGLVGKDLIPLATNLEAWSEFDKYRSLDEPSVGERPGIDYVVLPLYSTRDGQVAPKSGINQWNAGGRRRRFGEAYIPIPKEIRQLAPGFFPKDEDFDLYVPSATKAIRGRVCQQDGKALMSNPNHLLLTWLYRVLDPDFDESWFIETPSDKAPYTTKDLLEIGRDAIRVVKVVSSGSQSFKLSFAELGAYEEFVGQFEN
jgi:hypothetical protein